MRSPTRSSHACCLVKVFTSGDQAGEGQDQGVGYLDDGTMVVIEGGRGQISKDIDVTVTSILQTNAGRMIFAKYET